MTEALLGHLAEPAEADDSNHGGFAAIAQRLNALHPERPKPISRQLVHKWWVNRGTNKFPESQSQESKGSRVMPLFDLYMVELWYRTEHRSRPSRPPIETIPLFNLDRYGHPADAEQSTRGGHPESRDSYRSSVLDL